MTIDTAVEGTVLVVGASRGFGAALSTTLADQQVDVVAISRTEPPPHPGVRWYAGDVTADAVKMVPPSVLARVRHVVYSAGDPGAVGPAQRVDSREASTVLEVTCTGFMRVVAGTADVVTATPGGSYLLIGSQAARSTLQYLSVYSAAKAAAERYALCLAQELRSSRTRVNVLGIAAETDLARAHRSSKEELRGHSSTHPPLPEVADNLAPAQFLLSRAAQHVTGQVLEARQP